MNFTREYLIHLQKLVLIMMANIKGKILPDPVHKNLVILLNSVINRDISIREIPDHATFREKEHKRFG